jgi:hypothetical protein
MIKIIKFAYWFFLIGLGMCYLLLCGAEGIQMTNNASRWYVYLIIRVLVVFLFTIFNLLAMPFKEWGKVWLTIENSVMVFPIIGLLYGLLTINQRNIEKTFGPTICLFVLIGILTGIYLDSMYEHDYSGTLYSYILGGQVMPVILGAGFVGWFFLVVRRR